MSHRQRSSHLHEAGTNLQGYKGAAYIPDILSRVFWSRRRSYRPNSSSPTRVRTCQRTSVTNQRVTIYMYMKQWAVQNSKVLTNNEERGPYLCRCWSRGAISLRTSDAANVPLCDQHLAELWETAAAEDMAALGQLYAVWAEVARKTHAAVKHAWCKPLLLLGGVVDQNLGHKSLWRRQKRRRDGLAFLLGVGVAGAFG